MYNFDIKCLKMRSTEFINKQRIIHCFLELYFYL